MAPGGEGGMRLVATGAADINCLQIIPQTEQKQPADIVFVHGLATNMAFWYASIAMAFSSVARVTLIDLRGHGRSSTPPSGYRAPDLAADAVDVVARLGLERFHLVGHSYGALVAAHVALEHPDRAISLTLTDMRLPSVQPSLSLAQSRLGPEIISRLEGLGITVDTEDPEFGLQILTHLARVTLENSERAGALQKLVANSNRLMGRRVAKQWLALLENTTARDEFSKPSDLSVHDLTEYPHPLFAFYGRRSMTLKTGTAIARQVPGVHFEALPKAGHFFPSSRPLEFVRRLRGFLTTQAGLELR